MNLVHIGQPKAASSSIQRALWDNRQALAASGALYLDTQTKNHNPVVEEFLLRHGLVRDRDHFARHVKESIPSGLWDVVRDEVRSAGRVIFSSELLMSLPISWARRLLDDLGLGDCAVLLCTRRASDSLPSMYSQAARSYPTVRFEMWVRAMLRQAGSDDLFYLDTSNVVADWSHIGEVRVVHFDSADPARFEQAVLDAMDLRGVLAPPLIGHRNSSPAAARVWAWQNLVREGTVPHSSVLRDLAIDDPLAASLPGRGGRFALVPDVAELLDETYPMSGPVSDEGLAELQRRIARPEPVTTTGLTDEQWEQAVAMCVADLRERIR